jgi:hypothetical protein
VAQVWQGFLLTTGIADSHETGLLTRSCLACCVHLKALRHSCQRGVTFRPTNAVPLRVAMTTLSRPSRSGVDTPPDEPPIPDLASDVGAEGVGWRTL